MKYEKGKKITDNCQFKKGKKYISNLDEVFEFSHIGETGSPYFKSEGKRYLKAESEYNCIGFHRGVFYEAIEVQELPDEGLVASKTGMNLVYRTGKTSGYGFSLEYYRNHKDWSFISNPKLWRPATKEEEAKFIELLKKECERRGLFEDTKIKEHADNVPVGYLNKGEYLTCFGLDSAWNKNGCIFHKGEFAEPLEETTTLSDKITELIELGRSKGLKINVTIE